MCGPRASHRGHVLAARGKWPPAPEAPVNKATSSTSFQHYFLQDDQSGLDEMVPSGPLNEDFLVGDIEEGVQGRRERQIWGVRRSLFTFCRTPGRVPPPRAAVDAPARVKTLAQNTNITLLSAVPACCSHSFTPTQPLYLPSLYLTLRCRNKHLDRAFSRQNMKYRQSVHHLLFESPR